MDVGNIVLQVAIQVVLLIGVGLFLRAYLPSYFQEKGKNLATKEDIAEITDKIEAVRAQYERQSLVHKLAFEREFEILSDVWAALVDLQDATQGLRPVFDSYEPNGPEDERIEKRLDQFNKSHGMFAELVEKNRPFYPEEIYDVLAKIRTVAFREAVEYSYGSPSKPADRKEYYDRARENVREILSGVDEVCVLMRQRTVL